MMLSRIRIPLAAAVVFLTGAAACSNETPEAPEAPAPEAAAPETPPAAEPPPGIPAAADDTCGAAKYAGLVGRPADMPGVPDPGPGFRHITPDTHVTMDFREDRVNMEISAEGVITGFRCG